MIYTITTKAGATYKTTTRDIRNAAWTAIADQDPREITTAGEVYGGWGYDTERLVVTVTPDTGDWSGYETDALRVRDADGKATTIPLSVSVIWSEDGRSSIYVRGGEEAVVTKGAYDEYVSADDLLAAAGLSVDETDIDYTALAEEFVSANPDARYYVDDERGFANEWTLVVRTGARQDDDGLREITADAAVYYIADAVMDRREYETIHGCEPSVAAVWEGA